MKFKPDFDECISRIYAWYEQKVLDRVPVRFHHHNMQYESCRVVVGSWKNREERWLDVDFQVKAFLDSLVGTDFLGETFPVFWPNLSAIVYNLFLGQAGEFDDVTAWTHPCISDLNDLPELRVQRENKYFKTIEALTAKALERAEGRFMVGYTDMYAGVDCALGLRGAEQLCMDLVMDPDGIRALIELEFDEYPDVYRHFDKVLKDHNQLSVTWMNLPSFETFNVLACDFAVNISPQHFDEFCMPIIRKEAELFTLNVFHVDGPGVAKNIDSILTLPNLAGVQWVQGYGQDKPIMQWIPLVEKVQQAGKSIIVDLQLDELDEFMSKVDPTGIMLWIPAKPEDQRAILEKVSKW
ncbi:MAG: hypothetical protein QGH15_10230 [Kiritimatiellia bacterium]|jgi:hypothetical protein|nr:hypothetical protein [Kiritimatiellia bacterium]